MGFISQKIWNLHDEQGFNSKDQKSSNKAAKAHIVEVLIGLTLQNSNPFKSSNLRIKLVELLITCCTFFRLD